MFRPYNLTSITAWTVSRLAGNKAYYDAKRGFELSLNRVLPEDDANDNQKCYSIGNDPPYVRKLYRKLANIGNEVSALHRDLSLEEDDAKIDTTYLLKLVAYCNWLNSNKKKIKEEIKIALERALRDGYGYRSDIVQAVQSETDGLFKLCAENRILFLRNFRDRISDQEPQKDKALEIFDRILADIQVDERTWKLKKFNGDKLTLVKKTPKPQAIAKPTSI